MNPCLRFLALVVVLLAGCTFSKEKEEAAATTPTVMTLEAADEIYVRKEAFDQHQRNFDKLAEDVKVNRKSVGALLGQRLDLQMAQLEALVNKKAEASQLVDVITTTTEAISVTKQGIDARITAMEKRVAALPTELGLPDPPPLGAATEEIEQALAQLRLRREYNEEYNEAIKERAVGIARLTGLAVLEPEPEGLIVENGINKAITLYVTPVAAYYGVTAKYLRGTESTPPRVGKMPTPLPDKPVPGLEGRAMIKRWLIPGVGLYYKFYGVRVPPPEARPEVDVDIINPATPGPVPVLPPTVRETPVVTPPAEIDSGSDVDIDIMVEDALGPAKKD